MTITKTCNTCVHFQHCIGCKWDKDKGENTKWELKENPIVLERKVLEQIRAEIKELDDKLCRQFLIEDVDKEVHHAYRECIEIIDKYKVKSEE